MRNQAENTGTQSAARALVLLRHIGARSPLGVRLTDLVALTGMDKSTVHRLLACMVNEGFVERVPGGKHYRLGVEAAQLGLVSSEMAPLVDRFRPLMLKIARLSDESVYLVARSGHHALCVHRESGAHAQPSGHVLPGKRRVLGISAVGVSILAHGPDHDLEVTYRHNVPHYEGVGATFSVIRGLIDATRARGFSEMTAFGPVGTSGVGCAVPISETTHVGISIAGPSPRMSPARRRELGQLLHSELQGMARPVHSVPLF